MHRFALTLLGLGLALGSLAHGEEWSKTYTITGKPDLRVETSDANIHVDTWDQNTIEARVTSNHWKIGEGGVKITERQTGDSIAIEVRLPHNYVSFNLNSHRVDVDIHMPREGRVFLNTSDGTIRLSNLKGNMELQSSDGSQEIDSVDGSLRAHTSDGHIRANGRFDALDLSASDGRIEARALPGSQITGGWNLRAGDGSITLQIPENFAADVSLHTSDGHITADMPITMDGRLGEKNIRGKLNGGGSLLNIHTSDGSIHLEKS